MEAVEASRLVSPSNTETAPAVPVQADLSYRDYTRSLRRMALLLLAVGLVVRAERYLLRFPIWGDEAMVAVNLLDRDYLGLAKQLEGGQVVPVLFLWGELTVTRLLGTSEWAIRFQSFVFGCASLWLLWYLARQTGSRLAAMLSVGILAIAIWPISMSCFVKPYSADLFFSLALSSIAVSWLRRPESLGRLALLAVLAPFAIGSSYPAVFVGGAISMVLLPAVWRQTGVGAKAWYVVYNLLLIGSFLANYALVGLEQIKPGENGIHAFLLDYWADGFPPQSVIDWPAWLFATHTGRMMAYPYGDAHSCSAATFILFIIGSVVWWRTGRRALLMLMLLPFALNLFAAILHKYPYGGCCRLSQHLAPACCLLMGSGMAPIIEKWSKSLRDRLWLARMCCGIFLLCALATITYQAYRPYRDTDALWTRRLVQELATKVQPDDRVTVVSGKSAVILWWNMANCHLPVEWEGKIDWPGLERTGGRLWICDSRQGPNGTPRPRQEIEEMLKPGWQIVGMVTWLTIPRDGNLDEALRCDLYYCAPEGQEAEMPLFTQWPQR